ncbi:MAG: hypothetical protein NT155_02890 [Candidatus Staskawiczbacteria bacterium]|nr:hypothetical protein [Candidatus Staskawiczbacteria bacterium]
MKKDIEQLIERLPNNDKEKLRSNLRDLMSVYPFNEYEYIISNLLGLDRITLADYLKIRGEYLIRNEYVHIYEKYGSPTAFGITWAQSHVHAIVPEMKKPTKKEHPDFDNEYDFFYNYKKSHIKIEVKASRAVDAKSDEPLYVKALAWNSKKPFDMNFQQIKPSSCDVFIWVAVWRDTIKYWVFASKDIENNKYYSRGQHRGNIGEGQLHLNQTNIKEFAKYEAQPKDLLERIIKAYKRQILKID